MKNNTTIYGNRVLLIQKDDHNVEWVARDAFEHSRYIARKLYECLKGHGGSLPTDKAVLKQYERDLLGE